MITLSANLTMLFTEVDFTERFQKAAQAGFSAVEYMFPYAYSCDDLAGLLRQHNLTQALFNLPAGRWEAGERGTALFPDRVEEFKDGVHEALRYAKALDCSRVNCLVGLTPESIPAEKARETVVANLRFAAETLAQEGVQLLVEALNTRDIPGFYLSRTPEVLRLIAEVGHANLFYQYDVYHMQVMEGNITQTIRDNMAIIAHIQIADNPGRHEPGTGEINYGNLLRFIDEAAYKGFVGCEYKPLGKTEDGLGWITRDLQGGLKWPR
jgi:hydroxypyruvate isomerase